MRFSSFARFLAVTAAIGLAFTASSPGARAAATVDKAAPSFSLPAADGKTVNLTDYKGKWVVLEWVNYDCPFVGKQYGSGNMQKLQKAYTAKGVAWISINSSAPGKEGHVDASTATALMKQKGATPTEFLMDGPGTVGKAYGAKTTPHMFVIDPKGTVLYNGAIDDHPSTDQSDVPKSKNFVAAALDEAMAGKPVSTPVTQPYGCGVKY